MYQELIDNDQYDSVRTDDRVYLDLRTSSRYTKGAEELERNDSKINLGIMLKQLFRMRKQSVEREVWYIDGRPRKHRQKGGFLQVGAILGSLAGPALGALAGPIIKKIFG